MVRILQNLERDVGKTVRDVLGNRHENISPVTVEVYPVDRNPIDVDGIDRSIGKRTFDGRSVRALDKVRLPEVGYFQSEPVGTDEAAFRMENVALPRFVTLRT